MITTATCCQFVPSLIPVCLTVLNWLWSWMLLFLVFGRPFVKRFALCCWTIVLSVSLSLMLVYCGQIVGQIKMKLGMQVGLGPGDVVLDGDPAPLSPKRRWSPQIFGPCLLWPNGSIDQDGTWHGGRLQPRRLCVTWGPSPSPQKGQSPLPNFQPISAVAKRLDASRCHLGRRCASSQTTLC